MRRISREENNEQYQDFTIEEIQNDNDIVLDKISKGYFFEKTYNFICKCGSVFFRTSIFIFKISGIYLLWICLHYFSAHLYIKFCVPSTVIGFIMSPFMISTPHCQGLRWILYNAANVINNMWIILGAWIYSIIWITTRDVPPNTSK